MIMLSAAYAESELGAPPARFVPGQVVRHRRYGYRGVIVEVDLCCMADDAWYHQNKTQPDRDQPWYHVLVDETVCATYAAEENLVEDFDEAPVEHPAVGRYFEGYCCGYYIRNHELWVGS